jgi:hypothetical protein
MRLSFAACQINQLEFGNNNILRVFHIDLAHNKSQNTVTPTTAVVYPVTGHHLVLQAFPEVFKSIINCVALKLVNVL